MNRHPLKAVVFDFDGTLVHQTIDFGKMRDDVKAVLRRHGVDDPDILDMYVLEMIEAAADRLGHGGSGALASCAEAVRREAHAVIEAIECEAAKSARPVEGVLEMLARLRDRGVAVAVVTRNSAAAVRTAFAGVEDACDVFLPRECVRHTKPHPEHLSTCLKLLRVPADQTLMVGDHPIDIQAGRAQRMRTAGVLTGSGTVESLTSAGADHVLVDATHVLDLLGVP